MKKFIIIICLITLAVIIALVGIGMSTGYFLGIDKIKANDLGEYMETNPDYIYIDVRSSEQYEQGHIMGFSNVQSSKILNNEITLSTEKVLVVIDEDGQESIEVARYLAKRGYTVINVVDGVQAYDGQLNQVAV